jgi:hypothetical protein
MDTRRGFRRLAVFLTILYWSVVGWAVINPPLDEDYGYGYSAFAGFDPGAFLAQAVLLYAVMFGIGWTLYGFYGRDYSGRRDD